MGQRRQRDGPLKNHPGPQRTAPHHLGQPRGGQQRHTRSRQPALEPKAASSQGCHDLRPKRGLAAGTQASNGAPPHTVLPSNRPGNPANQQVEGLNCTVVNAADCTEPLTHLLGLETRSNRRSLKPPVKRQPTQRIQARPGTAVYANPQRSLSGAPRGSAARRLAAPARPPQADRAKQTHRVPQAHYLAEQRCSARRSRSVPPGAGQGLPATLQPGLHPKPPLWQTRDTPPPQTGAEMRASPAYATGAGQSPTMWQPPLRTWPPEPQPPPSDSARTKAGPSGPQTSEAAQASRWQPPHQTAGESRGPGRPRQPAGLQGRAAPHELEQRAGLPGLKTSPRPHRNGS